jgi:hypothetical protein
LIYALTMQAQSAISSGVISPRQAAISTCAPFSLAARLLLRR